ncbi:hypothetical protein EXD82_05215 [Peptacetobacter hominis]|uniref:Uncharacterized protein n=1 Tax=Peptacetobacter hominis TaxID=2743610 RepID=A0A544QVU6_9FIRM|nr:hypothetical protein [Peptacetobacter hominis]TQQ84804.1 hypothetical protein EXD82_05215 [Peptacetobacter hominis]
MKLLKDGSNEIIKSVEEKFAVNNVYVSEKEVYALFEEMVKILNELDWVETDVERINNIIKLYFEVAYLFGNNFIHIMKKIIYLYYRIRKEFDYSVSDSRIDEILFDVFISYISRYIFTHVDTGELTFEMAVYVCYGLNSDENMELIIDKVKTKLILEGGNIRNEEYFIDFR